MSPNHSTPDDVAVHYQSVLRSCTYPANLVKTAQLGHALDTYHTLIKKNANVMFSGTPVDFYLWDLDHNDDGTLAYKSNLIQDSEGLRSLLTPEKSDPHHRFM